MLGDPYATLPDVKNYLKIDSSKVGYDAQITDALSSVSREIEWFCNRQFNKATTATSRIFEPTTLRKITVDDFWTTSGLVVQTDSGGVGTFETTWAAGDYELEPFNNIVDGEAGWPYNHVRSCGGLYFPKYVNSPYRRIGVVQVTAQWGWSAVPAPVRQACLIMASQTFKLSEAPFGVAGIGQFGMVHVSDLPQVAAKLAKYVNAPVQVG